MTVTEEPTLYDVLEVDPASSIDELRAAVDRARETFGTESVAVYALVDEEQLGELRARLDEAAEVLLDPARRASYDRSIGRIGPATLWAEDDDEDEAPLPPVEPGPHARAATLDAEDEADELDEVDEEEAAAPRQQALALDVPDARGNFGRTAEKEAVAPDAGGEDGREGQSGALLSGDWAAAVPGELAARAPPTPAPVEREDLEEDEGPRSPVAEADPVAERAGLPPSLGLKLRPSSPAPVPEPVAPEPPPPPPPPSHVVPERPPEHATRPRESRRLDIAADAEFNGELLRRVRESYGLSLQQVAERTRITRIHLENVEADRYDKLPATVYLRGILVNLARELRLDPARVSKTYLLAAQRAHARGS
jgi:hypothetical protein